MQLRPHRGDTDFLADRRRFGPGNADDDLARRELAGVGSYALLVLLAGPVDEGFVADALDRFPCKRQRTAASRSLVGDDEVLGTDAEDTGFGDGELRLD